MKISITKDTLYEVPLQKEFEFLKEYWIDFILEHRRKDLKFLESFIEDITNYLFYINGYPYDTVHSIQDQLQDFKTLKNSFSQIINKTTPRSNKGIKLILSRFKFRQEIPTFEKIPPVKIFEDRNKVKNLVEKCIKYGDFNSWATFYSQLKSFSQIYSGVQTVRFFKPEAAKSIYDVFGEFETVWDMSVGFGGMMIGATASEYVKNYIGTEPSTRSFGELLEIKNLIDTSNKINLFRCGSENFIPDKNSLSVCFTSPPYFKQEQYSEETTQSYKKYPTQDAWLYEFLGKTLENCYYGLKPKGKLILNIANVTSFPTLISESKLLAQDLGFKFYDTYYLPISQSPSRKNLNINSEPILIFKK